MVTKASSASHWMRAALRRIETDGFLLNTDAQLPSLVALVVGRPVRGSWWGLPQGSTIYSVGEQLEDHPDVLSIKLIRGKTTWVHRVWWPDLIGIGTEAGDWQTNRLSLSAVRLWSAVERKGSVRIDQLTGIPMAPHRKIGDIARELEGRMLVFAYSVHTTSGRHATVLESWTHWRRRKHDRGRLPPPSRARGRIERRAAELYGDDLGAKPFPWSKSLRQGGERSKRSFPSD